MGMETIDCELQHEWSQWFLTSFIFLIVNKDMMQKFDLSKLVIIYFQ